MSKNSKKGTASLKIPDIILLTGKFLSLISSGLAMRFAARLFTTPLKHRIPKRELEMDAASSQESIGVPAIGKDIVAYRIGESPRKILLVHGWSGRGTQLVKFSDALLQAGFSIISFDAPAHGKSPGSTTLMPEFISSILRIEALYGPFEAAIGHSLGGMSLLNAMRKGLKLQRLVTIGSGDIIRDIMDDFVSKLRMDSKISDMMRSHFEKKSDETMDSFSSYLSAREVRIPVLVIHDNDDAEVPVKCAVHIHKNLQNGELMITKGLGHRKILGDPQVIDKVIEFITT